jgi:hypothetical protein
MLKKKNAKKQMKFLKENGVKIKCCYCDAKETCSVRANKEKTEKLGIKTFCTLTPNNTKTSKKKKIRSNKNCKSNY